MRKRYSQRRKACFNARAREEGGYVVTSPLDPELVTEAETVEEAFEMARDALRALAQSRGLLGVPAPPGL